MQRNGGNTLRILPQLACAKSCGNPCKSMTYGERNFPAIARSRTLPGVSTPLRPARCTGLQTAFMGWSRGSVQAPDWPWKSLPRRRPTGQDLGRFRLAGERCIPSIQYAGWLGSGPGWAWRGMVTVKAPSPAVTSRHQCPRRKGRAVTQRVTIFHPLGSPPSPRHLSRVVSRFG